MPNLLGADGGYLSHRNNLNQKARNAVRDDLKLELAEIERRYAIYLSKINPDEIKRGELAASVEAVGEYLDYAKIVESRLSFFNWRSDYASSIVPEYLYRMLAITLRGLGIFPIFASRDSVVEVSLSGGVGGGWDVRRKNQDLCIGLRRERIVHEDGTEVPFVVPLIAMEVKTNIDINKLNGLDFSAERLKRTFPAARYFLVTETIDFSLRDCYASGSIDEIYTLRKQVRSQARKTKLTLCPDVFVQLQADVVRLMTIANESAGHVYDRLDKGKLIHVR